MCLICPFYPMVDLSLGDQFSHLLLEQGSILLHFNQLVQPMFHVLESNLTIFVMHFVW